MYWQEEDTKRPLNDGDMGRELELHLRVHWADLDQWAKRRTSRLQITRKKADEIKQGWFFYSVQGGVLPLAEDPKMVRVQVNEHRYLLLQSQCPSGMGMTQAKFCEGAGDVPSFWEFTLPREDVEINL